MFKIVTPSGYAVCDDIDTLGEATTYTRDLVEQDKADDTYTEGFYKIVRQ